MLSDREHVAAADAAGRAMPKGIVRFKTGEIAVWRDDSLSWSVTGSARAWGDPGELLRTYGDYSVLDAGGLVEQLCEALRLTREYVGAEVLPAMPGWSWYDALVAAGKQSDSGAAS